MTVRITQKDIDNGFPANSVACPVHHATKRVVSDVFIDAMCTYSTIDGKHWHHSNPLSDWISMFDNKNPVKPGTFRMYQIVA